jgi:hypothetical protein
MTTDHEQIRRWVEVRGGRPALVKDSGVLRIDFPDGPGESLAPISWEEFFDKFEQSQLAFLYQEGASRFNKLVSRESA